MKKWPNELRGVDVLDKGLYRVRQEAKAHEDGYKEALKWMKEPENIEDHENDIKVSVPPLDPERELELELVSNLVDLARLVVMKGKAQ